MPLQFIVTIQRTYRWQYIIVLWTIITLKDHVELELGRKRDYPEDNGKWILIEQMNFRSLMGVMTKQREHIHWYAQILDVHGATHL